MITETGLATMQAAYARACRTDIPHQEYMDALLVCRSSTIMLIKELGIIRESQDNPEFLCHTCLGPLDHNKHGENGKVTQYRVISCPGCHPSGHKVKDQIEVLHRLMRDALMRIKSLEGQVEL